MREGNNENYRGSDRLVQIIRDIIDDLYAVESNKFKAFLSNRGFHAFVDL